MPPHGPILAEPDDPVLDDESNGFGGAQNPRLSMPGSFKQPRKSSDCSDTEAGSSSEDPVTDEDDIDDEASVNSFQSAQSNPMKDHSLSDLDDSHSSNHSDGATPVKEKSALESSSPASVIIPDGKDRKSPKPNNSPISGDSAYKRDRPEPLKDDSQTQTGPEETQLVPYEASHDDDDEEEVQVVSWDPLQQPPRHTRRSTSHRDSAKSVGARPLDPQEEERRRHEVDTAFEILEHMRRANLVMEFGPGVDLDACVFCLREQRTQAGDNHGQAFKTKQPPNHLHFLPRRRHDRPCIICHSPVCKKHWDEGFLHQQNVILCQDCAPLFDLDNLVECMNLLQRDQQEQHMRRLLILYDRALLALRHSSQSFDDNARSQLVQTKWHKEGMGIGSHVTNIASGVTGIAATAVFMTPMGPWLLLTSLALGGIATAVGSGSYFVERMCPSTQQAEQTIALASMVDSLLEATAILRQAQITGGMPPANSLGDDESEMDLDDSEEDCLEVKQLTQGESSCMMEMESSQHPTGQLLFLEEDKDQRLMITILKARKDREERPKNPVQFVAKRINKIGKDRAEEKKRRKKKDRVGVECEQQPQARGPLKRVAFRFKRELNRAKDTTVTAVAVAQTATTLAAVGLQAGGGGLVRKLSRTTRGALGKNKRRSGTNGTNGRGGSSGSSDQCNGSEPGFVDANATAARHGLGMFARGFFNAAAAEESSQEEASGKGDEEESESDKRKKRSTVATPAQAQEQPHPQPYAGQRIPRMHIPFQDVLFRVFRSSAVPGDASKGAIVAEFRRGDFHLKLRASGRAMKAFNRLQKAKRRLKNRRKCLVSNNGDGDDPQVENAEKRVFVKNARFLVKASLTVLRETARYAGGAFSAAIVCVETMELTEKVQRIRSKNGSRCSNVDQLDRLKQHVWENSGGFPDSVTLEWELFDNPEGDIAEVSHVKKKSKGSLLTPRSTINEKSDVQGGQAAPHWSSCFEGERPDGSNPNSPIINDYISQNSKTFARKANSTAYPAF